jgi:hypothetical protein
LDGNYWKEEDEKYDAKQQNNANENKLKEYLVETFFLEENNMYFCKICHDSNNLNTNHNSKLTGRFSRYDGARFQKHIEGHGVNLNQEQYFQEKEIQKTNDIETVQQFFSMFEKTTFSISFSKILDLFDYLEFDINLSFEKRTSFFKEVALELFGKNLVNANTLQIALKKNWKFILQKIKDVKFMCNGIEILKNGNENLFMEMDQNIIVIDSCGFSVGHHFGDLKKRHKYCNSCRRESDRRNKKMSGKQKSNENVLPQKIDWNLTNLSFLYSEYSDELPLFVKHMILNVLKKSVLKDSYGKSVRHHEDNKESGILLLSDSLKYYGGKRCIEILNSIGFGFPSISTLKRQNSTNNGSIEDVVDVIKYLFDEENYGLVFDEIIIRLGCLYDSKSGFIKGFNKYIIFIII